MRKSGWRESNPLPPHPKCGSLPMTYTPKRQVVLLHFLVGKSILHISKERILDDSDAFAGHICQEVNNV